MFPSHVREKEFCDVVEMEEKKYVKNKNPRVAGFSMIAIGENSQRILFTSFPEFRNFLTNRSITNGLGYLDNGNQIPHYEDSQEGLIRHLAHMDGRVAQGIYNMGTYLMVRHFDALLEAEDIAQNRSRVKQKTIECFAQMLHGYRKDFGLNDYEPLRKITELMAQI